MSRVRYTDTNSLASSVGDFIIRRRTPTIVQLALIFAATFIVALSLTVTTMDKLALAAVLIILLGAVGSYVAVQVQRSRDLVLTTEFQNALFASALGINNKFCLIIRQDGNIVYLDRSFQELFPDFVNQPRRTISVLLAHAKLSQEACKKIFDALENNVYDKVVFDIHDPNDNFHRIVMSIEPILRPKGFILLRGREFVGEHSAISAHDTASSVHTSTVTLFSHAMDTMDVGVYITNPAGNLVYVNPILEHWLGFKEGEITSRNLSVKDIVHPNPDEAPLRPGNYEGTITLQKKVGGLMQGFINQKIIRDDKNKVIGYTALVHNVSQRNAESKKQSW